MEAWMRNQKKTVSKAGSVAVMALENAAAPAEEPREDPSARCGGDTHFCRGFAQSDSSTRPMRSEPPDPHDDLGLQRKRIKPSSKTMCSWVTRYHGTGGYAAFAYFRHVRIRTSCKKDLADAIADNIVLVAIGKR
eukprot:3972857-Amphidinium_carterae.1